MENNESLEVVLYIMRLNLDFFPFFTLYPTEQYKLERFFRVGQKNTWA